MSVREVWVVEFGCYEAREIMGVYETAEAAMAAFPPRKVPDDYKPGSADCTRPGGWQPAQVKGWYMERLDPGGTYEPDGWYDDPTEWGNGLDWGEAGRVRRFVVEC